MDAVMDTMFPPQQGFSTRSCLQVLRRDAARHHAAGLVRVARVLRLLIFFGRPGFEPLFRRDWYRVAEQPARAPHLAHPGGCVALHIVLVTVPRVSRSLLAC